MQVTIDLVWSNITVIKNLKIHFATFVDGVLLKKKRPNKQNNLYLREQYCLCNQFTKTWISLQNTCVITTQNPLIFLLNTACIVMHLNFKKICIIFFFLKRAWII